MAKGRILINCVVAAAVLSIQPISGHAAGAEKPPVPVSSLHMKSKLVQHYWAPSPMVYYSELWYTDSGSVRLDTTRQAKGETETEIVRGDLSIRFRSDSQAALYLPGSRWKPRIPFLIAASALIKQLGPRAHLSREKTVLGRKCDVVEMRSQQVTVSTYTIDRLTGVELATSASQSGKPQYDSSPTLFEPNATFPSSVFAPELPDGMPVVRAPFNTSALSLLFFPVSAHAVDAIHDPYYVDLKHLSEASAVHAELISMLKKDQESGRKSDLKVLSEPTYVPARFKLLKVRADQKPRPAKDVLPMEEYDEVSVTYIDPKTGDSLILVQGAQPGEPDPDASPAPDFEGRIISRTKPFPYSDLSWTKDGVFFRLGGVDVDPAELIQIAKSLQPVHD